jgi:amicyanin
MEDHMKSIACAAALLAFVGNAFAGDITENQIKLFQFQPKELSVKAGTTVKWMNGDDIEHSVTAGASGKESGAFDSGFFKKNEVYEFTFAAPGTYTYFCKRHPSMRAKVTVTE